MSTRLVGRPREFDRAQALSRAARLFWQHGYSGTSTRMLSATLGISSSSLYAAFGSKSELFNEAVRTYAERYGTIYRTALAQPTLRGVLEMVLYGSIDEFGRAADGHPGCLTSSAAMADTSETLDVRSYVAELQRADEARLLARIRRASEDGDLPPGTDPVVLSELVQTVWQGLSVRFELGATRTELRRVAQLALSSLIPNT